MAFSRPSNDQQNFECVTVASVDFIKLPLKDILERFIKPVDLSNEIISCSTLLSGTYKLRPDQLKLCFPQPPAIPDYNDFDVTLLYTLIRNLCPSLRPTKGWGTPPDDVDKHIGDDIERLRLFRNEYYGHASSAAISDVAFANIWKSLKTVIKRIQQTTNASIDYVDELTKIERAKFTRAQLNNCKVLLEALVNLQQQKEEPDIVIKGEDNVVCGCTANFKADVKELDLSRWSIKWHKLSGTNTESIDASKEKYSGSTDTELVIQSVCKEDEGKYQAVISQDSQGMEKRKPSNIICLHVIGENHWNAFTKTEITTDKEMETLTLKTMIKFLLTTIKNPNEFWLVTDLIYILEDTLTTINDCGRSDLLKELITAIKEDNDIQLTLSRCGKRMYEVVKSMTMKYKSTELKITDGCVCFIFSFATQESLEKYLNLLRTGDDGLRRDISEVILNKTLLDIFRIDSKHVTWSISKVTVKRGANFVKEEQFSNTVTRITDKSIKVDEGDNCSFGETHNEVKNQPVDMNIEVLGASKAATAHHIALELQEEEGLVDIDQIINDPIWGPIELHPLCIKIIDTPEFQRLRSIKQLGGCSFVYPSACHSRFEHSIGTAYLARKLGQELQRKICPQHTNGIEITDKEILCLEVAGLCHDLGHGPFSHLFDLQFFKKARPDMIWEHEDASIQMIDRIFRSIKQNYVNDDEKKFIKDLIKQTDDTRTEFRKTKPFLYEIIANNLNKIDVDKWDYFSRDCHMLGLHHNFQCERSIQLARVVDHGGKYHISFPKSEYFNLFDMFFTRFTLHRRAYQHPVTKAVEMMIADAFLKADKSLKFPPNQTNQKCLSESVDEMDAYLWVTDDVLNQIRALNPDGNEDITHAQRLVERIYSREFYKLIGEKRVNIVKIPTQSRTIRSSILTSRIAEGMENKLKDAGNQEALFEIQMVVFNYGSGDQNPMDKVKLYAKTASGGENETSNCVENRRICTLYPKVENAYISKEEISDMLPTKFEQIYFRLMWKGEKEDSYQKLLTDFSRIKTYESIDVKVDFVDTKCTNPI